MTLDKSRLFKKTWGGVFFPLSFPKEKDVTDEKAFEM